MDVSTGTVKIAVLFPNTNNVLRPGMYARIRANTYTDSAALVVPQQAVMTLQTNSQVAIVNADNSIDIRTIKVGETSGQMVVIKEGVKLGEKVIVEGGQKVRNGMKVKPEPFAEKPATNKAG